MVSKYFTRIKKIKNKKNKIIKTFTKLYDRIKIKILLVFNAVDDIKIGLVK